MSSTWRTEGVDDLGMGRVGSTALAVPALSSASTIAGCFGGVPTLADNLGAK